MGSVSVVVVFVGLEDLACTGFTQDRDVVEAFAVGAFILGACGALLMMCRSSGVEDGVERVAVLAVAVAEQGVGGLRPVRTRITHCRS
jgi:hypothetical protein